MDVVGGELQITLRVESFRGTVHWRLWEARYICKLNITNHDYTYNFEGREEALRGCMEIQEQ
jgi:hypothetical protein